MKEIMKDTSKLSLTIWMFLTEKNKTPLAIIWEGMVQSAAFMFKNHPRDTLATRIPIAGTYQKSEVGIWSAIGNLLKNAFLSALVPKVDETVTINKVRADTAVENAPVHPLKPLK
jgi:hypothetical protein